MEQEYGRVVSVPQLTVREKATKDSKSIDLIPKNTTVKIIGNKDDFYKVQYGHDESKTGWVNKANILVTKGYRG